MAEQEADGLELEPVEVEVEIEVEQVGEIQVLLDFIDSPNIAEDIDEDTLRALGGQVCEDFNRDVWWGLSHNRIFTITYDGKDTIGQVRFCGKDVEN